MRTARLEELRQELEWRRCAANPAYFIEKYVFIRHPKRGRILFELRPAQRETLAQLERERFVLILKARQIGYSTLLAAYSLWLCFFHPDQYVIFLSKGEREAVKLLAKTTYAQKYLPRWLKNRGPRLTTENQQKLSWDNESTIESLPSKSDPARGEAVSFVVVDEWAFLENPAEAWAAIEPIADVGGRICGLSTANGFGNFFHDQWVRAITGNSRFCSLFYPWDANTDRDDDWYEGKAEDLPEWQLHQEYPRNPDEAFLKSGNPVFDLDSLLSLPTEDGDSAYIHQLSKRHAEIRWGAGPLTIWQQPLRGEKYVVGADVAEGLAHGDYSSAHVIRLRTGEVVAHWHGHIDPDLFGHQLNFLGKHYNAALIGVEVNNHGLTTLTALKNLGYPRIYYRYTLDQRTLVRGRKIGWRTQQNTKPLMIDELNKATRDGSLHIRCSKTIAEMKTYVRDEKGKMNGSPFDDRVVSLAIAVQMLRHVFDSWYEPEKNEWGTGAYWERVLDRANGKERVPIGANNRRQPR